MQGMHGIWVHVVAMQGMDLNLGCYAQGMHGIWVHVVAMQGMDLNLGCYARHAWNLGSCGCYARHGSESRLLCKACMESGFSWLL